MEEKNKPVIKIEIIYAAVLLLFMIGAIIFTIIKSSDLTNTTGSSNNTSSVDNSKNINGLAEATKQPEISQVSNPLSISTDGSLITLENGWKITQYMKGVKDSNFFCFTESVDECGIYSVTKGDYTFYISTSAIVYYLDTLEKQVIIVPYKTSLGEVNLTFNKVNTQPITGEFMLSIGPEQLANFGINSQIFGKLKDNVFVASGLFPVDNSELYQKSLNAFYDFLDSVKYK